MHLDQHKLRSLPALFAVLGLILLGLVIYVAFKGREYGHIDAAVVDAYTMEPIEGAILVFPDCGKQAITDKAGRAQVFGLPIHKHEQQNRLLPQPYGECTILVYREGYIPYALFYVQLQPGRIRSGPTIFLFRYYEGAPPAITIVEAPTDEWAWELAEKFRP